MRHAVHARPPMTGSRTHLERRFRPAHAGLAAIHVAQAVLVFAIAGDIVIPITHETAADATAPLVDVSIGDVMAAYFIAAAVNHALCATALRRLYEADLSAGRNRIRWAEFAVQRPPVDAADRALRRGDGRDRARGHRRRDAGDDRVRVDAGGAQPARPKHDDHGALLGRGGGRDRPVVDHRRRDDRSVGEPGVLAARSSCPWSSCGRASGSTSGSSTTDRAVVGLPLREQTFWCSAWSPSRRWPGGSWPVPR